MYLYIERQVMVNTPGPEYLCNLGLIYFEERDFNSALQNFQEAQQIYQKRLQEAQQTAQNSRNYQGLVTCLMNIGLTYDEQDQHELAISYLQQARILARSLTNKERYENILASYKSAYSHLVKHLEQKVLTLLWDEKLCIRELLKLADEAYVQQRYYTADYWYQRAEQLGYSLNDSLGIAEVYRHREQIYSHQSVLVADPPTTDDDRRPVWHVAN